MPLVQRWLVLFKSHAEGLADVHFVDVTAPNMLAAVLSAKRARPTFFGPWAIAAAHPWPRGARGINAAVLALTGTD